MVVYAIARNINNLPKHQNIHPIELDITNSSVDDLITIMKNIDAIIFTAGSRGNNLLQVDAFGAVKAMQAAEKANIKKFILLSSLYALEPEHWNDKPLKNLTNFNIAKFFADNYLMSNTNLNYVILQPGFLTDTEYTGKITIDINDETIKENSIADVAETLVEITLNQQLNNRIIKMSKGKTNIKEAIIK